MVFNVIPHPREIHTPVWGGDKRPTLKINKFSTFSTRTLPFLQNPVFLFPTIIFINFWKLSLV
jgi:hypothetical protein